MPPLERKGYAANTSLAAKVVLLRTLFRIGQPIPAIKQFLRLLANIDRLDFDKVLPDRCVKGSLKSACSA